MATVDLEHAYRVIAKGKVYWYAWKGKGAPRLSGEPGSEEFLASYLKAHSARKTADTSTIKGLLAEWQSSDIWTLPKAQGGMAESTKKNWRVWLPRIEARFGKLPVKIFDHDEIRRDIKKWLDKWKNQPRTADYGKQVLSALLSYAVEEGKLSKNPCIGIANRYTSSRAALIWLPTDLEHFAKTASTELMFALRLACLTGLRETDLLLLEPREVGKLSIEKASGKSSGSLHYIVPMYGALRELLDEIDAYWNLRYAQIKQEAIAKKKPIPLLTRTTVLFNSKLKPWSTGFSASWNKACWAALGKKPGEGQSLKDAGWTLHFHDARGTAATRFYLARDAQGAHVFTLPEIAEILAWSVDKVEDIIKRYVTKDALLKDKIRRMDEAEQNAAATDLEKPVEKPVQNQAKI